MNRKYMPLIIMLTAGAVTCVITYIRQYSIMGKLGTLLLVLILFYFLGNVLKWTIDRFEKQNTEKAEKEAKEAEEAALKEAESTDGE